MTIPQQPNQQPTPDESGQWPSGRLTPPKTAKEYWAAIEQCAAHGNFPLAEDPIWQALHAQISPLILNCGDSSSDIGALIQQIADLPFPAELGLADSGEYDNISAGIIEGLNKVLLDQGAAAVTPVNAPEAEVHVHIDMGIAFQGGAGRAEAAWHAARGTQARKDAISLNTTQACKDALASHFADHPEGEAANNWKRLRKFDQGDQTIRVFRTKSGSLTATVAFDSEEEEPDAALLVIVGDTLPPAKGKFPTPVGREFSGRVLYMLDGADNDPPSFSCGPECTAGEIDDRAYRATGDALKRIFNDYDIKVNAAENWHAINPKPGQSPAELIAEVEQRLNAAGAVKMEME